MVTHTSYTNVQPMAGAVLDVAELIILSECVEARAERCQEIATGQNAEHLMICTEDAEEMGVAIQEFAVVRSKIFNLHSIRSVTFIKLNRKAIKGQKYVNIK